MGTNFSDNETDLIYRIRDGDTNAFRQLVNTYKDVSLSLSFSILKDQDLAEDVLQDAFIKVFEKIDTFKFGAKFSTWLYRIVVNTSYNALKKSKNHYHRLDTDKEINVSVNDTALRQLKEDDQKKYIQIALENLRSDEALVLRLFYLCELNINEIKQSTGFSKSKIKVDLHRGRNNFYFELQKIMGTEIRDLL
ncbi:RNA polymerase sigma factor [Aquimarina sp. 2201CG5-10]|uniref:RNA polymerase sigma factor n=1 Tax=Aquimarina callyspongiae TaxID=3098150 RepID=UPI002AB3A08D|nr:sigma-70 family RNA polymerase sigma factor [Aquimarina sp. 2201CG5-10]MDY8137680.1 sigma-70 family RNA polymerase sigma factor [Aquimarina sp. 2201CG5-10]